MVSAPTARHHFQGSRTDLGRESPTLLRGAGVGEWWGTRFSPAPVGDATMILLRRDLKTGRYLCPKCGTSMTRIDREGRHPREQLECPDQVCGHTEAVYDRHDEGEA